MKFLEGNSVYIAELDFEQSFETVAPKYSNKKLFQKTK